MRVYKSTCLLTRPIAIWTFEVVPKFISTTPGGLGVAFLHVIFNNTVEQHGAIAQDSFETGCSIEKEPENLKDDELGGEAQATVFETDADKKRSVR